MKKSEKIIKDCKKIYEEKGQSAVFDYANKHNKSAKKDQLFVLIHFEHCNGCDTESPSVAHNCLVCGQETKVVELIG